MSCIVLWKELLGISISGLFLCPSPLMFIHLVRFIMDLFFWVKQNFSVHVKLVILSTTSYWAPGIKDTWRQSYPRPERSSSLIPCPSLVSLYRICPLRPLAGPRSPTLSSRLSVPARPPSLWRVLLIRKFFLRLHWNPFPWISHALVLMQREQNKAVFPHTWQGFQHFK